MTGSGICLSQVFARVTGRMAWLVLNKDGIGRRLGIQLGHIGLESLVRYLSGDGGVGLGVASMEV